MSWKTRSVLRRWLGLRQPRFGQRLGWIVEHQGRRLARLDYVGSTEMFWETYRVLELADAPYDAASILGRPDVWNSCAVDFRSIESDELVTTAFASGEDCRSGVTIPGTVTLRGLHLERSPTAENEAP